MRREGQGQGLEGVQPQAGLAGAGGWESMVWHVECSFCRYAPGVPPEAGNPHRIEEVLWARSSAGL